MRRRLLIGLLAGGLMASMLPGVASAGQPVYLITASCLEGGQKVDILLDQTRTMREWRARLKEVRQDFECEKGSITIEKFERQ